VIKPAYSVSFLLSTNNLRMAKRSLLSERPSYIGLHVKCPLFLFDFKET
jgi:hypothetical protein